MPGSMQQKRAAERLSAGVGAVHNWVKAYREGGMAALQTRNRNAAQNGKWIGNGVLDGWGLVTFSWMRLVTGEMG
ncbi:DNA-binding protein [Bifidobacterium longum subsp. infantis]|uniref:DNA-binding helix-turn-helix protein n=2 Tax=Bifidobacterium longum TaxID=216816 RepID=A0AAV3FNS3_BIFLL|nr:DNA-binding helix-turn-helix protein [Bifidobacterium longum subsp. longum 35B]EIJ28263.1 DNA-binding helix-turn-helix protein [Bifidobacterium longum subsp. longum 2-2B]MBT9823772.1 DNA-binding protein [Bifidobacterium longum]MCB5306394.1 DNA-binding protein [Bifidobacterium longum subsp. infantis]QSY60101.1 DNA-binding protein [Bifidobacterium longum subsp. longum]